MRCQCCHGNWAPASSGARVEPRWGGAMTTSDVGHAAAMAAELGLTVIVACHTPHPAGVTAGAFGETSLVKVRSVRHSSRSTDLVPMEVAVGRWGSVTPTEGKTLP